MTDRLSNHGPKVRDALWDMTEAVSAVDELCVLMQSRLRKLEGLARNLAWSVDAECESSMDKAHKLMDFLKEDA